MRSVCFRITESTGILTLSKPLDHENAAVVMFHAEVADTNADPAFPNQTDTGNSGAIELSIVSNHRLIELQPRFLSTCKHTPIMGRFSLRRGHRPIQLSGPKLRKNVSRALFF